jgi:hypothetical protein
MIQNDKDRLNDPRNQINNQQVYSFISLEQKFKVSRRRLITNCLSNL